MTNRDLTLLFIRIYAVNHAHQGTDRWFCHKADLELVWQLVDLVGGTGEELEPGELPQGGRQGRQQVSGAVQALQLLQGAQLAGQAAQLVGVQIEELQARLWSSN